jgi:tetratricopeptide (TPR) repeat protein
LLYELLTGTTPFDQDTFRTAALDEVRRIIREQEPPRPSTRLSTLGDTLTTVSSNRRADPWHLNRTLRGELDWIVMKALEKDRRRRYETASALAADVMRYLTDQPVEACSPSVWYRFTKYTRRNRGVLTTVAIVLLALLVATGVSTSQALRARDAEARAEADFRQARDAVDRVILRASDELANVPGTLKSRRALLEDALAFYQGFLTAHSNDLEVKFDTARAELRVASIHKSIGDLDQVESPARRAITLLVELVKTSPQVAAYHVELIECHNLLAAVLDKPHGNQQRRTALALCETLVADHPRNPAYLRRLAGLRCNLGLHLSTDGTTQFVEAEEHLRAALAIWSRVRVDFPELIEDPMELGRFHLWMGNLLGQTSRQAEAEREYRRSLAVLEDLRVKVSATPALVERIAHVKNYLALLKLDQGERAEAEQLYREIVAGMEPLCRNFPEVLDYPHRLATAYHQLGFSFWKTGHLPEAEEMLSKALAVWELTAKQDAGLPYYLDRIAMMLRSVALFLDETGRPQESVNAFRRLIEIQESLAAQSPGNSKFLLELAWWLSICPVQQLRDPPRAVRFASRAVELDPASAMHWRVLGIAHYRAGELPAAMAALDRAVELDSGDRASAIFLAMIYARHGDMARALSCHAEGVKSPDDGLPNDRLNRLFSAEALSIIHEGQD